MHARIAAELTKLCEEGDENKDDAHSCKKKKKNGHKVIKKLKNGLHIWNLNLASQLSITCNSFSVFL